MSKNKLFSLLLTACSVGFIYLLYHLYCPESKKYSVCIIKSISGFPCPSCGATRAVLLLFKGDFIGSIMINPFGIIISAILILMPLWIVIDFILKKETFYTFYNKMECHLKQKKLAIPLIILVILIWIWNIYKEL
jgi:hypothetical protein